MSKHTDAPEIFHPACAYTLMGSLLTRHKYRLIINRGVPPIWTNLWTILVGDAANDRKTTCISMMTRVLDRIDPDLRAPDETSPEGFLDHLERRGSATNNPSAFLVQRELLNLLMQFKRSYSQTLKPLLMDFYDTPPAFRRKLVKKEYCIREPRVSLIGAIATELLAAHAQPDDWLGGLFSRCLLICGSKSRKYDDPPSVPEEVYVKLADGLWDCLKHFRKHQVKHKRPGFDFTADARPLLRELNVEVDEPHLRLSIGRGVTHLMKVAAIEQVDEDPEALAIGKAATERALKFVLHWRNHVGDIVSNCFTHGREEFEGDRLPRRIMRYIQRNGGAVPQRQILRNCSLSAEQLRKALATLQEAEWVRGVERDGSAWWELIDGEGIPSASSEI